MQLICIEIITNITSYMYIIIITGLQAKLSPIECSSEVSALTAIRITSPDKHKQTSRNFEAAFFNDKSSAFVL